MQRSQKKISMTPRRMIYKLLLSHYWLVSGLVLTGLIQAACGVGIPWCLKGMIDTAIEGGDFSHFNQMGFVVLGLAAILYVSYVSLLRIAIRLVQVCIFELRQDLYSHILLQPLSFSKSVKIGQLMHHVQQDVHLFETNLTFLLHLSPFDIFSVIGIFTLMFITNQQLLFYIVLFLACSLILTIYLGRPLLLLGKTLQNISASFNARLQDIFTGLRTVKNFGREQDEIKRLDDINHEMVQTVIKSSLIQSLIEPFAYLIEIMGVILVIWFGAYLIMHHKMSPGELVAFLMYAEILAEPSSRIVKYFESWRNCRIVTQRLCEFIHEMDQVKSIHFNGIKDCGPIHSIRFNHVNFKYPHAKRLALNNINFVAQTGEVTALVGRNGAGKSTVMDLIMGLQIPSSGKILIDNICLTDLKETAWRKQIGILSQDVHLFNDSIGHNIAYGKPRATIEDIQYAIKQAHLEKVMAKLPDGIDTRVGDKGNWLSGGELQKIAIARLYLQDPKLLIFDEPSSHLDTEAVNEFVSTILELAEQRVVLLIEHRPEVIMQVASQVIVIDAGQVIAIGSHQELLECCEIYRTLLNQA